ncbi:MAG TPA: NAD(P)H-quinone oxidoreductase [Vicinamibacterales bacterium]|nr:NAD(P)H-quinone oxidoreductase [Vicinamibacterales bacterium]
MRCIEIATFGPPEGLRLAQRPDPVAGPGEVLIAVRAAGVNRPDVIQRYGKYPPPPGASDIPGLEVAGTVRAVGPGVARWKPGDQVCALVSGGGYAELSVAPEVQCLPVPAGRSMVEAAAIPETYFTVWTNLFERGRLAAGEWVLVHGGTSGIGTTAVQLAAAFGARVGATAGSDEKCAACRALGAAEAWNYRTTDWVAAMQVATGGRGADVVLDIVGAEYLARNIDTLAIEGRLVQIAFLTSARAELDLSAVMRRRLWITGSTLRPRSPEEKGAIARQLEAHVWPLIADRRVGPVIDSVFPLAAAAEAHRRMEGSAHVGKIVLDVGA